MLTQSAIQEQLSLAYVHAVTSRMGYICERPHIDVDSIDVEIRAIGKLTPTSTINRPCLALQLKAHIQDLPNDQSDIRFELKIKNYNDLRLPSGMPCLLVVLFLPSNQDTWLSHDETALITRKCAYWVNLQNLPATTNTQTITITIPRANVFSPTALKDIMEKVSKEEDI